MISLKEYYKISLKTIQKFSRKLKIASVKKSGIPALFFLYILFFFHIIHLAPEKQKSITLTMLHEGFHSPVQAVFPEKAANVLYVVEQEGKIYRIKGKTRSLFLDITGKISKGYELGLLSMAVPPSFSENIGDVFYVNYTTPRPYHTVIGEIPLKKGKNGDLSGDFSRMRTVMKFAQPYSNHNGGLILFGPDGYLYIGTGDGGSAGDPENNAQNPRNLLGKILRINPEKSPNTPYRIPADTTAREGVLPEIYAMGLRNPWRFSFDHKTGLLYAGDVGQNRLEEIDIISKGGNYGWRVMEGNLCYNPENCNKNSYISPIHVYGRTEGISVTGGYVYRGVKIPELYGKYIFADYGSGNIWALDLNSSENVKKTRLLLSHKGRISSFAEDAEKELYIIDHGAGKLFQIR